MQTRPSPPQLGQKKRGSPLLLLLLLIYPACVPFPIENDQHLTPSPKTSPPTKTIPMMLPPSNHHHHDRH
jgi:hypothetical protein